jgi:hypothetical protein
MNAMNTYRGATTRVFLVGCVATTLLTGTCSAQAATAGQMNSITVVVRIFVQLHAVDPLTGAIWAEDMIACLDTPAAAEAAEPYRYCLLNTRTVNGVKLNDNVLEAAARLFETRTGLLGTWSSVDSPCCAGVLHFGTLTIDENNIGTLQSDQPGSARLLFALDNDSVRSGAIAYSFAYVHTSGDKGYGAFIMSDNGCRMYGRFRSTSGDGALGTILLARC